jgi:hypothetical protein
MNSYIVIEQGENFDGLTYFVDTALEIALAQAAMRESKVEVALVFTSPNCREEIMESGDADGVATGKLFA